MKPIHKQNLVVAAFTGALATMAVEAQTVNTRIGRIEKVTVEVK